MTIIQWNNAKIHTSEMVKEFARCHEQELFLINQPSYSPELNPQENMWKWLKDFISKSKAIASEQELIKLVSKFDNYITAGPQEVQQRLWARIFFNNWKFSKLVYWKCLILKLTIYRFPTHKLDLYNNLPKSNIFVLRKAMKISLKPLICRCKKSFI